MKLFGATALTLVLPLGAMIAGPAAAETLDELYAKAKAEGEFTFYGGGPQRIYEDWIKQFEARFPGVTVKLTGGYSGGLAPLIDKQLAARKVEVDFVTFQAIQEFLRWKSEGVLLPFKMEGYDELDPTFRDPDGVFTPISVFAIAPAYNTKLVAAQDVPKSALDFLKPVFHGRLITAYPQDDDATLFAFNTIVKKYGWKFMQDYMATQPKFIQGHLGVVRSVASGESLATFDMMVLHTMEEKSQGHSIEVAFATDDPIPVWGQLGAIFKDSPHPNAAKLYLQWYMAKEQQSRIGTWSARRDMPPPLGLKPLLDYKIANDFSDIVTDPKVLADLRKSYAAYVGDITNRGGIR
jgi:ABC-type Fe3+ transport system substrate-binding protein